MTGIWQTVRRQIVVYFPRVLKLIWDASPRYASLTLFLMIVSAAALPAQIWISKVIIDRITEAIQASQINLSTRGKYTTT